MAGAKMAVRSEERADNKTHWQLLVVIAPLFLFWYGFQKHFF
jgi:hypothetical protein